MTTQARYDSRYPRQGTVALLCEGDVAGYEVDLLEKWSALTLDNVLLDAWPCGTKTAILGMSDSIGRSIPVYVIEDRDWRAPEDAKKDCEEKRKDREKRGVRIGFWRSWQRHEIENYLIEPAVLVPTLSRAFQVSEPDVNSRLELVIKRSRVDQAAQFALDHLRARLPDRYDCVQGLPKKGTRPEWDGKEIVEPSRDAVEKKLKEVVETSYTKFSNRTQQVGAEIVLEHFRANAEKWAIVSPEDNTWRVDWSGKEILTSLCRWLAGEFGLPDQKTPGGRRRVDWKELNRIQQDAEDREIAWKLQPLLCASLLDFLKTEADGELHREWREITEALRSN